MKKLLMMVAMAVCVFGFSACGSSDDDEPEKKTFTINGEWMTIVPLTNGGMLVEFDNLSGNTVKILSYTVSGSRVIENNSLVASRVTDIKKEQTEGTFIYEPEKVSLTYILGDKQVFGFVSIYDYEEFVWTVGLTTNIDMIRSNSKTNALKSQLEQEYQAKYAK